ncbi:MAG: hypothetical protein IV100_34225 [Myxococcales bacterium]|nr:hypothetical protein [Myxococcales bacterium]
MKSLTLAAVSAALATTAFAATASAAADLAVSTSAPAGVRYYDAATYRVSVTNVGNQTSTGGSLQIDLPRTATSPQVYTLGQVTSLPSGCTLAASRITCAIPSTKRNVTRNYDFGFKAPYSASPIAFSARIVPAWTGDAAGNNLTSHTLALSGHTTAVTEGAAYENRHCTGTGLSAFFECTLFPSSISSHETTFAAGGVMTFTPDVDPAYTGAWQQNSTDSLSFQIFESGVVIAEFEGQGIGGGCFEGLTHFWDAPGVLSPYVSPYEVCPL